jgi:hypothetical protein
MEGKIHVHTKEFNFVTNTKEHILFIGINKFNIDANSGIKERTLKIWVELALWDFSTAPKKDAWS